MKTSNYILIAFFTFLFGGIFALFIAAKTNSNFNENTILDRIEQPLGSFSVVVAKAGAKIELTKGTASKIMKVKPKDKASKFPEFIVRNDTLFVSAIAIQDDYPTSQITYQKINAVLGEINSQINLDQFVTDTFNITMRAGKLYYFPQNPTLVKSILNIQASQGANIQINTFKIRNLNLSADGNSVIDIQNTIIDQLSGTLKNWSRLTNYAGVSRLNLEVDSTSTYYINKR
ncbi:MAG TPA: hypothetical protein VGK10_08675 [Prolixibacteraceae bacterium]